MKLCYQKFFFLTVFIFCVLGIFFSCTKIPELTLEEIEELISSQSGNIGNKTISKACKNSFKQACKYAPKVEKAVTHI